MNTTYLVSYGELLLMGLMAGFYFLGSYRGAKKAKRDAYQNAYQNDLNNKLEELLYKDDKKQDNG